MVTIASDNPFPSVLMVEGDPEALAEDAAAGQRRLAVGTDHLLYLVDDAGVATEVGGGGYSDPLTTRGDVIVRNASNVTARLAIGSSGKVLQSDGTDVSWQTPASGGGEFTETSTATRTAGDLTTTSTTWVDATSMSVTITTAAVRCLVFVSGSCGHTGSGSTALDIDIDGSRQGQTFGLAIVSPAGVIVPIGITYLTGVLSAASHTFKLQWRVDAGTGQLYASTGVTPLIMTVIETSQTT